MRATTLFVLTTFVAGCASTSRFGDQPVVWELDDRASIAEPEEAEFLIGTYLGDVLVFDRVIDALSLPRPQPAQNVNALEEVPNSSWFTNRIGRFDLSPEEVAAGPSSLGGPLPPYVVVRAKSGGGNPGFIIEDRAGRTFVVKFDPPENPEMQTGTNVIVNRFLWAAGYNVPADYVFWFRPEEVSVHRDAENDLDPDLLRSIWEAVPRQQDGRYRATASEFLEGVPKGGFHAVGVREDDPNDVIPHQHRRELRGLKALAAWLNHTDVKDDNTLDMFVEEGGRRFLKHFFVDFGEALGGHQAEKGRLDDGFEYFVDWGRNGLALVSLGIWTRPWERQRDSGYLAIGAFGADTFRPEYWREAYPYRPFLEATATDLYWGAKIVTRFGDAHIEEVVGLAQFSEPGAADYLASVLRRRRDAVGRVWLDGVTALDDYEVRGRSLCMTDLAVARGFVSATPVELLGSDEDGGGDTRARASFPVGDDGHVCVPIPKKRYAVLRLRTVRTDGTRPVMQIHVRGVSGPRVLGVVRVE